MEINRDFSLLHPVFRDKILVGLDLANKDGYPVQLFEGWRSPVRQEILYKQGRTLPGKVVTRARAWQSWHQYGIAGDIALRVGGKWSWDGDFGKFAHYFLDQGLEWLKNVEQVHYQLPVKYSEAEAQKIHEAEGILAFWSKVGLSQKP